MPALAIILLAACVLNGEIGWRFYSEKVAEEALNAGNVASQNEDWRTAVKEYTRAIQLRSDYAEAYGKRSEARMELDDVRGSEADAQVAVNLDPKNRDHLFNLAAAQSNLGELDQAVRTYDQGILLLPGGFDGYMYRAMTESRQGDVAFARALADFSRAIADSGHEEGLPYRSRALFYDDLGKDQEALDDYREALAKNDMNPSMLDYTHFRVWILRARQGNAAEASIELSDYLDLRPNPNDWPGRVGAFLAGQLSEHDFLARADDPDPVTKSGQNCEAYFYSGTVRAIRGDTATAAVYFQKSINTQKLTFEEYYSAQMALARLKRPAPVAPSTIPPVSAVVARLVSKGLEVNWTGSVVDLMNLVGVDSSFAGRKKLAVQLGYRGDLLDGAALNAWLQEALLQKIAAGRSKVGR